MRRVVLFRGAVVVLTIAVLMLAPYRAVYAKSISFGGGAEDHFWNVNVTFCKDGFMVSAVEVVHPDGTTGDDLPFSLVLSRTTSLITTPLPAIIGGGVGGPDRELAHATAYYTYTTPLAPDATTGITLERWEHGDDNADDDSGDGSVGDDRQILSAATGNCTLLTPPVFDVPPSPPGGSALTVGAGATLAFPVEASDADGIDIVTLGAVDLPPGASFTAPPAANPAVSTFSWTPTADQIGRYTVVFTATDATGRSAPASAVTISVISRVGLPMVVAGDLPADVVVTGVSLSPDKRAFAAGEPVQITVELENHGPGAAAPFWVDLYLNPTQTPALNQTWNMLCGLQPCFGMAWYLASGLPPGGHATLTSLPGSYASDYTIWPGWFAAGTTDLYVYADSWHPGFTTGASGDGNTANNLFHLGGLAVSGPNPPLGHAMNQAPAPRPFNIIGRK